MKCTGPKDLLSSITEKGKVITVTIEINDPNKAAKLLGTMYGDNVEELGVTVQRWGFHDTETANAERIREIEIESRVFIEKLNEAINKTNLDYLLEKKIKEES